ncbi:MAG: YdeI family protein [Dehalococcoidia bacterium]
MDVVYFASAAAFRAWLEKHHDTATELWVGYYKKGTGKQSITHPEAVDQALCFGWIDGVRWGVDAERFANRFTPRTRRSNWSAVNIKRVGELMEVGLMQPAGIAAFEKRDKERAAAYSFEQGAPQLGVEFESEFQLNAVAWEFFRSQAPWYQRIATWWVISAKREETRRRRLATLIEDSERGERIALVRRPTT